MEKTFTGVESMPFWDAVEDADCKILLDYGLRGQELEDEVMKLLEQLDNKCDEIERLKAIDSIMKHTGLSCGTNPVEGEDGGILSIFTGSFEQALDLHDLLIPPKTPVVQKWKPRTED